MKHFCAGIAVFLVIFVGVVTAEARNWPAPTGHVSDFANVLTAGERTGLESTLQDLESKTTIEVAVVTVQSLNGNVIENAVVELWEEWGIGKKDKNNGLLFMAAMEERKMRFEVGYGLEGALPNALIGRVMDELVVPRFKDGLYGQGIRDGVMALVQRIMAVEGIEVTGVPGQTLLATSSPAGNETNGWALLLFGIFFFLIVFLIVKFGKKGGSSSGSSSGSGWSSSSSSSSSSFGGGSTGGGGTSRGW